MPSAEGQGWQSYNRMPDVLPQTTQPVPVVTFRIGLVVKSPASSREAIQAKLERMFAELRQFGIELDALVIGGGGAGATPE